MNVHQRIAHESLLRTLPVRTVTVPDSADGDIEDKQVHSKNVLQLAAEREHRILKFMRPRVRYRFSGLILVAETTASGLHVMLARMVERELLTRHGTRRKFTYSKR